MSKKFSRVLAGARYQQELTNYLKWLQGQTDRQPNIGKKGNRPASKILYVKPFAYKIPAGVLLQVSGADPAWESYKSSFSVHTVDTLPENTESLKIRGYRAARVNIITGRTPGGVVKTSHITEAKYLSYGGKAQSVPFGQGASGTETEIQAFDLIKTSAELSKLPVYLIPEKI